MSGIYVAVFLILEPEMKDNMSIGDLIFEILEEEQNTSVEEERKTKQVNPDVQALMAPSRKKGKTAVTEKWGVAGSSFTQVPNLLLENKQRLELNDAEMVMLLHLIKYWWYGDHDQLPFPSTTKLAQQAGKDIRQVQRILNSLETNPAPIMNEWSKEPGYITRVARHAKSGRQQTNNFDLRKLANALNSIAKEREIAEVEIGKRKPRALQRKSDATHQKLKNNDYLP